MSQANYEWLLSLSGILHITVQMLCFLVMWHVFYPERNVLDVVMAGMLACVNLLAGTARMGTVCFVSSSDSDLCFCTVSETSGKTGICIAAVL